MTYTGGSVYFLSECFRSLGMFSFVLKAGFVGRASPKGKSRGLRGVLIAVSDDHPGLKRAIAEV